MGLKVITTEALIKRTSCTLPDFNLTKLGWERSHTEPDGREKYLIRSMPTDSQPNQRPLAVLLVGNGKKPVMQVGDKVEEFDALDYETITAKAVVTIWNVYSGVYFNVPEDIILKAGQLFVADKIEMAPEPWVDECTTPMEEYGLLGTR